MRTITKKTIDSVDINDSNYQYIVDGIKLLSKAGYEVGEYNPHGVAAYLIQNDRTITVAIGAFDMEAIDNAVDSGAWDSLLMTDEDFTEYSTNKWDDSYIHAGNASEAFWAEHLYITKLIQA